MGIGTRKPAIVVAGLVAVASAGVVGNLATSSASANRVAVAAKAPKAPHIVRAHRLRPRHGAVAVGTVVGSSTLVANRVFANGSDGFSMASVRQAQYPAHTVDGGHVWRIDGPQLHIDAADAPEAVSYVGLAGRRTFFAYGSSAVDVTSNAGHTWWEAFLGEAVVAVVSGPNGHLVAYAQEPTSRSGNTVVTWQYVSRDGGRIWHYTTALGG